MHRDEIGNAANVGMQDLLGLVRRQARRLAKRLPESATFDDLVSAGQLGLAEALDKFDATRGVPFAGYAVRRIRGAMLDELRACDVLNRRQRDQLRRLDATANALATELGRAASHEEVARASKLTLDDYFRAIEARLSRLSTRSYDDIEAPPSRSDDAGAEHLVAMLQETELLRAALEALPERLRTVVRAYYLEDRTLREIGEALGVSEVRAHQLRAKALHRLRSSMGSTAEHRLAA